MLRTTVIILWLICFGSIKHIIAEKSNELKDKHVDKLEKNITLIKRSLANAFGVADAGQSGNVVAYGSAQLSRGLGSRVASFANANHGTNALAYGSVQSMGMGGFGGSGSSFGIADASQSGGALAYGSAHSSKGQFGMGRSQSSLGYSKSSSGSGNSLIYGSDKMSDQLGLQGSGKSLGVVNVGIGETPSSLGLPEINEGGKTLNFKLIKSSGFGKSGNLLGYANSNENSNNNMLYGLPQSSDNLHGFEKSLSNNNGFVYGTANAPGLLGSGGSGSSLEYENANRGSNAVVYSSATNVHAPSDIASSLGYTNANTDSNAVAYASATSSQDGLHELGSIAPSLGYENDNRGSNAVAYISSTKDSTRTLGGGASSLGYTNTNRGSNPVAYTSTTNLQGLGGIAPSLEYENDNRRGNVVSNLQNSLYGVGSSTSTFGADINLPYESTQSLNNLNGPEGSVSSLGYPNANIGGKPFGYEYINSPSTFYEPETSGSPFGYTNSYGGVNSQGYGLGQSSNNLYGLEGSDFTQGQTNINEGGNSIIYGSANRPSLFELGGSTSSMGSENSNGGAYSSIIKTQDGLNGFQVNPLTSGYPNSYNGLTYGLGQSSGEVYKLGGSSSTLGYANTNGDGNAIAYGPANSPSFYGLGGSILPLGYSNLNNGDNGIAYGSDQLLRPLYNGHTYERMWPVTYFSGNGLGHSQEKRSESSSSALSFNEAKNNIQGSSSKSLAYSHAKNKDVTKYAK